MSVPGIVCVVCWWCVGCVMCVRCVFVSTVNMCVCMDVYPHIGTFRMIHVMVVPLQEIWVCLQSMCGCVCVGPLLVQLVSPWSHEKRHGRRHQDNTQGCDSQVPGSVVR